MKEYLGDAVYVDVERGMIVLTTSNGMEDTNTIYMEPEVYEALLRYVARQERNPPGSVQPAPEGHLR